MNKSESKKGKKIALVAVFVMLIFVFAFGGYSFAKYTTKGTGTDSASVAAWGIKVTANNTGNFKTQYASADGTLQVSASDSTKVVAPGTSGSMTLAISGSAEVAVGVKMEFSVTEDIFAKYGTDKEYHPLKFKLSVTGEDEALVEGSLNEIANYVAGLGGKYIGTYGVNYNFDSAPVVYTLSWEWAFFTDADTDILDTAIAANDTTAMVGEEAVSEINQEVAFTWALTVDQINSYSAA